MLILAHDEAEVIGNTALSIMTALSPDETLVVVADNCTDETVMSARSAGAQVFIRSTGSANGKGEALAWFLKEHADCQQKYVAFVILDADSKIQAGFLQTIKAKLANGSRALQCFVYPVHNDSPVSQLAAFSDLLEQTISDRLRSKLGWPVRSARYGHGDPLRCAVWPFRPVADRGGGYCPDLAADCPRYNHPSG